MKKNIDILNQKDNKIKCFCSECKQDFIIFPEHLGKAFCQNCDVKLIKK